MWLKFYEVTIGNYHSTDSASLGMRTPSPDWLKLSANPRDARNSKDSLNALLNAPRNSEKLSSFMDEELDIMDSVHFGRCSVHYQATHRLSALPDRCRYEYQEV